MAEVENGIQKGPKRLEQNPKKVVDGRGSGFEEEEKHGGGIEEEEVYSPQSPKAPNGNLEGEDLDEMVLVSGIGERGDEEDGEEEKGGKVLDEEEESSPTGIIGGVEDGIGKGKEGGRRRSTIELLRRMFSRNVSSSSSGAVGGKKGRGKGKGLVVEENGEIEEADIGGEEIVVNGVSNGGGNATWESAVVHQGIEDVHSDDDSVTRGAGGGVLSMPGRRKRDIFKNVIACINPKRGVVYDPWTEYALRIPSLEPDYAPEFPLLEPPRPEFQKKITLVLDLDETLVHSSFVPMPDADFSIPLQMEGQTHMVYVRKRPSVDKFLKAVTQWYEVIVFTASLSLYANPVMDMLDAQGLVHGRLYREHCVMYGECYVKDIGKLGRDIKKTIIIDNSPLSYVLQPENAFPINGFTDDMNDRELDKTLSLLEKARHLHDVRNAYS